MEKNEYGAKVQQIFWTAKFHPAELCKTEFNIPASVVKQKKS